MDMNDERGIIIAAKLDECRKTMLEIKKAFVAGHSIRHLLDIFADVNIDAAEYIREK